MEITFSINICEFIVHHSNAKTRLYKLPFSIRLENNEIFDYMRLIYSEHNRSLIRVEVGQLYRDSAEELFIFERPTYFYDEDLVSEKGNIITLILKN